MITEKGKLNVGIDFCEKTHYDFELRPAIMRDTIDASADPKYKNNDMLLGLAVICKQLVKLGDIPKDQIVVDLLLDMTEHDLGIIAAAKGALEQKLATFSGKPGTRKSTV